MLDALNDLGFAYRWTTRWIALDKTEATRNLTRLRRQWFAKRKSVGAILREVMFNRETALVDPDADNKAMDADEALQELGADDVAFGYLTTAIVVCDADAKQANEKQLAVERIINGRGFVTTIHEFVSPVELQQAPHFDTAQAARIYYWLGTHISSECMQGLVCVTTALPRIRSASLTEPTKLTCSGCNRLIT